MLRPLHLRPATGTHANGMDDYLIGARNTLTERSIPMIPQGAPQTSFAATSIG